MREWLDPYVRGGYFVTAFRVAGGDPVLSPVCMSFQTPAPFYPYREPDSTAPRTGRSLRVHYLGATRVAGHLGDTAGADWNANVLCSRRLTPGQKSVITASMESYWLSAPIWGKSHFYPTGWADRRRPANAPDRFWRRCPASGTQRPVFRRVRHASRNLSEAHRIRRH